MTYLNICESRSGNVFAVILTALLQTPVLARYNYENCICVDISKKQKQKKDETKKCIVLDLRKFCFWSVTVWFASWCHFGFFLFLPLMFAILLNRFRFDYNYSWLQSILHFSLQFPKKVSMKWKRDYFFLFLQWRVKLVDNDMIYDNQRSTNNYYNHWNG